MKAQQITDQLQRIASSEGILERTTELTDSWTSAGEGVEIVDPVLRFIEQNPSADLGMPGPLVHFVERFFGSGYEEKLVESVQRKPTSLTVWMLNRVINGTKSPKVRRRLIVTMEQVRSNPLADHVAVEQANRFVRSYTNKE